MVISLLSHCGGKMTNRVKAANCDIAWSSRRSSGVERQGTALGATRLAPQDSPPQDLAPQDEFPGAVAAGMVE